MLDLHEPHQVYRVHRPREPAVGVEDVAADRLGARHRLVAPSSDARAVFRPGHPVRRPARVGEVLARWALSGDHGVDGGVHIAEIRRAVPLRDPVEPTGLASDGAILMTSGGSDGIWPSAVASRVEGGYRVSGRKVFCSQAPAATLITTSAVYEDPREGMTVLAIMVPMSGEGVRVIETWDTLGMRGTSSHDTQLTEVFVPDQAVITRREWGRWTSRCVTRSSTSHRPPPPSTLASQQGRAMRR